MVCPSLPSFIFNASIFEKSPKCLSIELRSYSLFSSLFGLFLNAEVVPEKYDKLPLGLVVLTVKNLFQGFMTCFLRQSKVSTCFFLRILVFTGNEVSNSF